MLIFLVLLVLSKPDFQPDTGELKITSTQIQRFEESFSILNDPLEFLPGWTGNEVRSTSSRIFQTTQGKGGSKALAVQAISTFNGVITIRLNQANLNDPLVEFWARSVQNGAGTRAAEVYYAWKKQGEMEYSPSLILGGVQEFSNEDQDFRKFQLSIPENLKDQEEIVLKLEVRYGSGTGNAARWVMDDFEFGEIEVDRSAPQVKLVRGFDEKQIELIFNEALDPVFSRFLLNYEIAGIELQKAELKNDSIVYLFSELALKKNENYQVRIRQIPDLAGNFMGDTLISFTFFDPTNIPPKGIVINELMPAPKADLDLPNVEYVELFNASDQAFRLEGLSWSNSKTSTTLLPFWIAPDEYLILAPANQAAQLEIYGSVLPVKNWPTLLNSGDVLTIAHPGGAQIDQVSYSSSTWKSSEFANGGYSLEVVNPFYSCDQSTFLQASKDKMRGSPGRQNSVFSSASDAESIRINASFFRNDSSIILDFTKPILPTVNRGNILIEPMLEIAAITFEGAKRLNIQLKSAARANLKYQLKFVDFSDCSGAQLPLDFAVELILAIPAKRGDLVINELLFDPKTGFPKFVELQNVTDSYLEFSSWQLGNFDTSGRPAQLKKLGEENLQIPPKGFVVFTTNASQLQLAYPNSVPETFYTLSALPSYPISGGTVVLMDGRGDVTEAFTYSEELHHPLLRDSKGVSLERISYSTPVDNFSNWHSASGLAGYATPGKKNSQYISSEFDGNLIQIEPEVFDPEGRNGNSFTSIKYELDQAGWLGSFRIYSISGQLIQSLAQNEILGSKGLFTWTGTDASGKIVRPGYYLLLVELYDLSGNLKSIKKTIVVATKF